MPGVGAILGVIQQGLEKRGLQTLQIALSLTDDMAGHELWRILKHVDKAMQFAQDVIGQMMAGLGLTVDVERHIGIAETNF